MPPKEQKSDLSTSPQMETAEIFLEPVEESRWIQPEIITTSISRTAWREYFAAEREKQELWYSSSPHARLYAEQQAVESMLRTRSTSYRDALNAAADAMKPMPDTQRVGIVIPAYNESDTMENLLTQLAGQTNTDGSPLPGNVWSAIIVINCPHTGNNSRIDTENLLTIQATIEVIDDFQSRYQQERGHELPVDYVVARFPTTKNPQDVPPGVGAARMIGHDVMAIQSNRRSVANRGGSPMYLQTLDADIKMLDPHFIATLIETIDQDAGAHTLYRETGQFTTEDRIQRPLLNAVQFFWNDTLSVIAEQTDMPWTVGRGMLIGLYAHSRSGGVFPFRHPSGNYDEDTRIGAMAQEVHGHGEHDFRTTIERPLFSTEPSREIFVIGDLLQHTKRTGGTLTRYTHDIATLLESYRNYGNTVIRGRNNSPRYTSEKWLLTDEAFEEAMPHAILTIMANSWRELIRTELSINFLKDKYPAVQNMWNEYILGGMSQIELREQFNAWEFHVAQGAIDVEEGYEDTIRFALTQASLQSTRLMSLLLTRKGIEIQVDEDIDHTPPATSSTAKLAQPIRVVGTTQYRKQLCRELLNITESN